MLTRYGVPLLLRAHDYLCAWSRLLFGDCACRPAFTESNDNSDAPEETSLHELRSLDSRATVSS